VTNNTKYEKKDTSLSEPYTERTRCGFVTIVGLPNSGKSTLTNTLVQSDISIVTHKAQTTKSLVQGISTLGPSQLILVDTPGLCSTKYLPKKSANDIRVSACSSDLILLLIDSLRGWDLKTTNLIRTVANWRIPSPCILVLNKIDLIKRNRLLEMTVTAYKHINFQDTFMVSSRNGSGTDKLLRYLHEQMPYSPWLYPEDQISNLSLQQLAQELTRRHMLLCLHDELPYNVTLETTKWQQNTSDNSVKIHQTIYVLRPGHKKIIIGKLGETIKPIAMGARRSIAKISGLNVHLFLFVKVREYPKNRQKELS